VRCAERDARCGSSRWRCRELFAGTVPRTIAVIARTLEERGDPELIFAGEVAVDLQ
jgi:hypothetical protein